MNFATLTTGSCWIPTLFKMSAFSRGLFLRHQCQPATISSRIRFIQARTLSSSRIFRAATKTKVAPKAAEAILKSKQLGLAPGSQIKSMGSYQTSYADVLASKTHTTLLYQAPSHTGLFIACYGTSLFCLSYAGTTYYANVQNAPADLALWIPIAFGGVSLLMAILGGYVLQTPRGIVRSITAIPKTLQVRTGRKGFGSDLQIEVELKKMFPMPFFPARKIYVTPSELKLPHKLVQPAERRFSVAELARLRAEEEAQRKKAWEYDQSNLLTSPFRHMSQGFFKAFKAMKMSWSREGFMKIEAKGEKYKMDVLDGWALDSGKALDRLAAPKKGL